MLNLQNSHGVDPDVQADLIVATAEEIISLTSIVEQEPARFDELADNLEASILARNLLEPYRLKDYLQGGRQKIMLEALKIAAELIEAEPDLSRDDVLHLFETEKLLVGVFGIYRTYLKDFKTSGRDKTYKATSFNAIIDLFRKRLQLLESYREAGKVYIGDGNTRPYSDCGTYMNKTAAGNTRSVRIWEESDFTCVISQVTYSFLQDLEQPLEIAVKKA